MSQHESFAGRQFYHGTTMSNADGTLHEGAEPRAGMYGPGFYSTPDEAYATKYSARDLGAEGAVLRGTTDARIKHFETHADIRDHLRSLGKDPYNDGRMDRILKKQGYGGMYSQEDDILVTFDRGSFLPNAVRGNKEPGAWTDLT